MVAIPWRKIASKYVFDENAFRYMYILSLFFSFVCLVELPAQVVTYTLMPWALLLMANKLKKNYRAVSYLPLLAAFLISGCITAFLHIRDNFWMNVLMLVHVAICFFIFYASFTQPNKGKLRAEMIRISVTIVRACTLMAIPGMVIAIFAPQAEFLGYRLGLMDNRYTGMYTNPNLCAFVSVVAMVFCLLLTKENRVLKGGKRLLPNWLMISCFGLNFVSLLLTDSNSSLIFFILFVCIYIFCNYLRRSIGKRVTSVISGFIALALLFAVIGAGSYGMRLGCQYGMAAFMNDVHNLEYEVSESGDNSTNLISLGRSQRNEDATSGRSDSWNKALILIEENPGMGIGKANITEYANRYLARGLFFSDLHNGYLTILVSSGVVGFLIFMIFSVLVAKRIIIQLFTRLSQNRGVTLSILFSMICAYCAYAFFEKALLFDVTFMVVVFWLVLGYAMAMTPSRESKTAKNAKKIILKTEKWASKRGFLSGNVKS